MERRPLMTYLPELYRDIKDFVELMETEDVELDDLAGAIEQLLDDQFVMTSSEAAIKRREQQLNIKADPTNESLDFRKIRIINRYTTKPPFTVRYLQDRLDFLVGAGKATVEVDVQNFVLKVTVDIPDAAIFKEMEYTIKTVKPANLVYIQSTALAAQIGLQERIYKIPLNRMTQLSTTWKIGQTPFAARGQEVQVK
ncbi:putative phage tail protein [Paenibacillus flagellatus]|uniref:Phage portal protein n=1 Tax=Paenibacillus flagellatus TaxID=2211139 RepID=A0A2V5KFS1_9BACL|nr:putative phage tail protein [Paenibacillus flagellatus]PYI57013.1 phage portal protein [Paenibacillus flagellatus]